MKGTSILIDRAQGREMAALMVDGQLTDLLIDPTDDAPRIGAIYRATVGRLLKGMNGAMLDLGGVSGFLKQAKGLRSGQSMLVQVSSLAETGKAPPVTTRLLFKSRYAIISPGAPGFNVARSIHDEEERVRLLEIADEGMTGAPDTIGLILRSACAGADADAIATDIANMREICMNVLADADGTAELLLDAPEAGTLAWRDWDVSAEIIDQDGCFEQHGVWDAVEALKSPLVPLDGGAFMYVEPTRALVAIDVNTGSDFSVAAGLKANISAARNLPRALRLRGFGGQITVDFAPLAKKDRRQIEQVIKAAFRKDGIETNILGWTPLGHLELQRKRSRRPLSELL